MRYAAHMNGVEINSSFYRHHRRATYERWAAAVPMSFRFAVKVPRTVTQDQRLENCAGLLDRFLEETSGLGAKLGVLLVQLPPSLAYDVKTAETFFFDLARAGAAMVCEPRHPSWFTPQADTALKALHVHRAAADPPRAPSDGTPGGDTGLGYYRMHGSPKIYHSDYSDQTLERLRNTLRDGDWCIFDNTAAFCAMGNALTLRQKISGGTF